MRKHSIVVFLSTLFLIQTSVTFGDNALSNKQCDAIVETCKNAGFNDEGTGDKSFWFACMRPLLLGKTVNGVTINIKDIRECRRAKIADLKKEVRELQNVK